VFDLDAYLDRIGLKGDQSLEALHRAHVCSIPFENLDPYRGAGVSLAPAMLERKLVAARRGGYCFEHNVLLMAALEALGLEVEPMLGRVRLGVPPERTNPLTHMLLRVRYGGEVWHADVGFGRGTLLEPIPFGPGGPYEQSGWRFRVVDEDEQLVLQTEEHDQWADVYSFVPRPVPPVDIELGNWFTSTHPTSRFLTGLIVAGVRPDGSRVSLSDWGDELALVSRTPSETTFKPVERVEIPGLLASAFGLSGWAVDGAGRIVPASGE
jgi:N-hydroxyarylamine O-acetyltransferase